ncbi:universal stress protein [Streptomyces sp. YKOK-I1]
MIVCEAPHRADATGRPPDSRVLSAVVSSDRPLVLVPDGSLSPHGSGKVLLGVDARAPSDGAIGFAFDSARVHGARLHVVHAWSFPPCAAAWPLGVPEKGRAQWEDHEGAGGTRRYRCSRTCSSSLRRPPVPLGSGAASLMLYASFSASSSFGRVLPGC